MVRDGRRFNITQFDAVCLEKATVSVRQSLYLRMKIEIITGITIKDIGEDTDAEIHATVVVVEKRDSSGAQTVPQRRVVKEVDPKAKNLFGWMSNSVVQLWGLVLSWCMKPINCVKLLLGMKLLDRHAVVGRVHAQNRLILTKKKIGERKQRLL
jgi:hypothetical protein